MVVHRTYDEEDIIAFLQQVCGLSGSYADDEGEELYEMGLIDECGNWIDRSTTIGI